MADLPDDIEDAQKESAWSYWWREWIFPFLLALILAFFIRGFIVQAFKIPTGSMRTTLLEGDRILVDKVGFCGRFEFRIPFTEITMLSFPLKTFREPERGDIIVFRWPQNEKRDFVKRLVAFGGDTISIKDGHAYVNGELLDDPAVFQELYYYNRPDWNYGRTGQQILVPEEHFFVLGDNSRESSDSRNWGFVPRENLIGRAMCIYWPVRRLGGVKS